MEPHRGHVVLPLTRQDIVDIFWLQATIATELAIAATNRITDVEIDELDRINNALAGAVGFGDAETIAAIEFSFHRVFNEASSRIKSAWFLRNAARYMPAQMFAADPEWGAATLDNHRQLIAALRHRDAAAVVERTVWQFTDAARRLTETLERTGIFGASRADSSVSRQLLGAQLEVFGQALSAPLRSIFSIGAGTGMVVSTSMSTVSKLVAPLSTTLNSCSCLENSSPCCMTV